ncbi:MAG: hypothetical protein C4519_26810 [Desulfobacteraceae bacterium]|nr:MAG: hypothetical protein C4519_26810 [Desulfobacteraceae bacterium]
MPKRSITPAYIFFFILFWPDTWRIAIGLTAAGLLSPLILTPDLGEFGKGMIFFMLACMGYAAAALPARAISRFLQKWILKGRRI